MLDTIYDDDKVILTSFQTLMVHAIDDLRYAPHMNLSICTSANEWDASCISLLKNHIQAVNNTVSELLGTEVKVLFEEAFALISNLD